MEDQTLTTKEMCVRFGVTPRTLRHYEYIELLAPAKQGRTRYWGPREIARLTLILRGRRFGFSLEEMRQWLLIYDHKGSASQLEAFLEMADRRLAELEEHKRQIDEVMKDLRDMRADSEAQLKSPEN